MLSDLGVCILKINKISGIENQQIYGNSKVNKNSTNQNQEKQITELSNICYKPVSFGRTKAEHKSWGASVNPKTKEVPESLRRMKKRSGVAKLQAN